MQNFLKCVEAIIYLLLCNLHDCTFKSSCFALFYRNILRKRPEEKLENAKNLFFLYYVLLQNFFHEAVSIEILEYFFQK